MPRRALVVDANILVRAVLGKRVHEVIEAYAEDVSFLRRKSPSLRPRSICQRS
jgi:hypothetical protein